MLPRPRLRLPVFPMLTVMVGRVAAEVAPRNAAGNDPRQGTNCPANADTAE